MCNPCTGQQDGSGTCLLTNQTSSPGKLFGVGSARESLSQFVECGGKKRRLHRDRCAQVHGQIVSILLQCSPVGCQNVVYTAVTFNATSRETSGQAIGTIFTASDGYRLLSWSMATWMISLCQHYRRWTLWTILKMNSLASMVICGKNRNIGKAFACLTRVGSLMCSVGQRAMCR